MSKDVDHPYITDSNQYYMNPWGLYSMGIKVDLRCVVCGRDTKNINAYCNNGYIHCLDCALKHGHISKEDYEKYKEG